MAILTNLLDQSFRLDLGISQLVHPYVDHLLLFR